MAEIPSCKCPSSWSYGPHLVGYLENSSLDLGKMKPFWLYSIFQMGWDHHLEMLAEEYRIHRVHLRWPFGNLRWGSFFESLFYSLDQNAVVVIWQKHGSLFGKLFYIVWPVCCFFCVCVCVFSPLTKWVVFFELEGNQWSTGSVPLFQNVYQMGISSVLVRFFASLFAVNDNQPTKKQPTKPTGPTCPTNQPNPPTNQATYIFFTNQKPRFLVEPSD